MRNKKMAIIFDFAVLALCALIIGFMACNALGGETGWNTLQGTVGSMGIGVPIAYLVALVCLIIVVTILAILADFNVIKNAKFANVVNTIVFAAACFMMFLFIVVVTQLLTMEYASEILGWASIVNIILGFITGILIVVNTTVFKRK